MNRKLSTKDQAELGALRERALTTIDYIANVQYFPLSFMYRDNIERAASVGDLRKLRFMARDIDQMTIGLDPHQRDGLEAVLQSRLGVDKEAERAAEREKVAKTLSRGTIRSEKERQHLEDYAAMLEATGGDQNELRAIRNLLHES